MSEEIKGWKLVPAAPTAEWSERYGRATLKSHPPAALNSEIAAMLAAAPEPSARTSDTELFHAAIRDLAAINECLELDPDDGGAEPIISAINELKDKCAEFEHDVQDCLRATIVEPSASVGMEPVGEVTDTDLEPGDVIVTWTGDGNPLKYKDRVYSGEQLSTLQAKLEQAEKDKAELVDAIKPVLIISDRKHDAWDTVKELITKYEVKK